MSLASHLIEKNKKTRATFLDLGNCGLTRIPEELGDLVWLEGVSFSTHWTDEYGRSTSTNNNGPTNNIKQLITSVSDRRLIDRVVRGNETSNPFFHLTNLKHLWLRSALQRNSGLTDLTPLSCLTSLQTLDLSNTPVSDLTPLSSLINLKTLDLSNTKIADLTALTKLLNLQEITVMETQVADLSPLATLIGLKKLNIGGTLVTDFTALAGMAVLQELYSWGTEIADLTPLVGLKKLQSLGVSDTNVADLSPLAGLTDLTLVIVFNTLVSDLTPLLSLIRKGIPVRYDDNVHDVGDVGIYVEACPLTNPPAEVVKQGNKAILNYFKEREAQGVDHLYEAKLLIVGEGGAGKTSLLRRLYQTDKGLPEETETTKGIDIHRHEFKLDNGRVFRLNVWDFGGQEIYHATHQFFLTKRSLYLLLDDTRKDNKTVQDEGFKYWLEIVDQLSDHSPILIFQNEKGDRSKTIDLAGIKGRFDNVMDCYKGNLEKADAADSLRDALEFYARQLPHIGEELPARWVLIRAEIETLAEKKPYITQQDYFDLYSKYLAFDREKALYLSRYFHDLGVFLHFQDDLLLAKTVILQNTWATEAVFKMLDNEITKSALGRFTLQDCQRVWRDSQYADMHPDLLALMQKFELCYRLPDVGVATWLAPQLLPPSKPDTLTDWEQPGDLLLRYRYEFLPKGLISRLMVRLHRFVSQPELGWVTGVLFERNGTEVLVAIPPKGGEIALRARGAECKELLSVIAAELDALNDSFHGLKEKVEKLVPCNCIQCQGLMQPRTFELRELLRRKKYSKFKVECPGSFVYVDVLELLDGIRIKDLPAWADEYGFGGGTRAKTHIPSSLRTIKIFLASSSELLQDRNDFELYFLRQNHELQKRGVYLNIIRWENFLDAMSETRLQSEYNKAIRDCDIFVSLFFTKTGKYTEEEFNVAHQQFMTSKKPQIYTFFKNANVNMGDIGNEVVSLLGFKKKLGELGHFFTGYNDVEHLKRQFKDQLEILLADGSE